MDPMSYLLVVELGEGGGLQLPQEWEEWEGGSREEKAPQKEEREEKGGEGGEVLSPLSFHRQSGT